MKRFLTSFVFTAVAIFGLLSCANNSGDKEIVDFFTEGFTERALEPFSYTCEHYVTIMFSEQFADWEKEFTAINCMVISKYTDFGKQTIVTGGKPRTEAVVYRVDLDEKYKPSIDKIVKKIVAATKDKTGIELTSTAEGYVGKNKYMSITLGNNQDFIALTVENLLTDNTIGQLLY